VQTDWQRLVASQATAKFLDNLWTFFTSPSPVGDMPARSTFGDLLRETPPGLSITFGDLLRTAGLDPARPPRQPSSGK